MSAPLLIYKHPPSSPPWLPQNHRRDHFPDHFRPTDRFHEYASELNVSATDLYTALLADAELQPPNWDLQGRQANVWKLLGAPPEFLPLEIGRAHV